jgi:hypothetical protein
MPVTSVSGRKFTYSWADAAARAAQTGMVKFETGFQIDTAIEYFYDGSAWQLFATMG